jgi:hypothetical protein
MLFYISFLNGLNSVLGIIMYKHTNIYHLEIMNITTFSFNYVIPANAELK